MGPYIGALVAATFWMTITYIRFNYDHNYKCVNDDSVGQDESRDIVDNQSEVKVDQRK